MEFQRDIPKTGVAAVDDTAAELRRLREAAGEAEKDAVEARHALERAEHADREARAAAIRKGGKAKAGAADKARAELERLQSAAADYAEAVRQANHDLHTALTEHGDEIRGLAGEREAKARSTLLKAIETLEQGRAEFAHARALTAWLDRVAEGGTPSAAARRGHGTGTIAPTFSAGGYLALIPRSDRRQTGHKDDTYNFDEVLAALRNLIDPPLPEAQPLRPVPRAA